MDETPTEETQEETAPDTNTQDTEETSDSGEETLETDVDPIQGTYMMSSGGTVQDRYMTQ